MTSSGILNAMESLVYERDRQEFALGDTLDIKTGLILASLTFLAIQSGSLIHSGISFNLKIAQFISVLAMIFGGCFSVWQLVPRDYNREANPEKYQTWIADMDIYSQKYPDAEPLTKEAFISARLSAAMESIKANQAINKIKSRLMIAAFYCTAIAFALNIATLAIHLF